MRRLPRFVPTIMLMATSVLAGASEAAPPPAGGTIAIEPRTADGEYDPTLPAYVDAAKEALTDRGFTVLDDDGHAAYALELVLGRSDVGTALANVPGQSRPVIGPGVIVPFSTGKSDIVPLRRIRLEMRLRRRGEPSVVWHAAAVTVRAAGSRKATEQNAMDLSRALLRGYPAEPQGDIGVP
jgi:hypothetical protein